MQIGWLLHTLNSLIGAAAGPVAGAGTAAAAACASGGSRAAGSALAAAATTETATDPSCRRLSCPESGPAPAAAAAAEGGGACRRSPLALLPLVTSSRLPSTGTPWQRGGAVRRRLCTGLRCGDHPLLVGCACTTAALSAAIELSVSNAPIRSSRAINTGSAAHPPHRPPAGTPAYSRLLQWQSITGHANRGVIRST